MVFKVFRLSKDQRHLDSEFKVLKFFQNSITKVRISFTIFSLQYSEFYQKKITQNQAINIRLLSIT